MSALEVARRGRKRLRKMKQLRDDATSLPLTGGDADEFNDEATEAKLDYTALLTEPDFSGITGTAITQPGGSDLLDWLEGMADPIVDSVENTTNLQTAANQSKTISANAAACISQYSTP